MMRRTFFLSIVFCVALLMSTEARRPARRTKLAETMRYLKKYGYMNTNTDFGYPITSEDDPRLAVAVERMQGYFHLPATGRPDRELGKLMKRPRCGCPDVVDGNDDNMTAVSNFELPLEYSRAGRRFKWRRTELSYQYLNYPSGKRALSPAAVQKNIQKAFQLWSDVTPLTFRQVVEDGVASRHGEAADIKIKFGRRNHHPDEPSLTDFDGKDGELAHAFAPNSFWGDLEGDIHFDDDDLFTVGGRKGYDLLLVAAHEIGHSLGLAHSNDPNSLMWPIYKYVPTEGYVLPKDDVRGIQAIYGKPDETLVPRLEGPAPDVIPARGESGQTSQVPVVLPDALRSMCDEPVTALLKVNDELFAFRDDRVWRIRVDDRRLISPTEGEPARRYWKGIPDGINGAYRRQGGDVVLFKGDKYYVYRGRRRVGRQRRISRMGVERPPMAAVRANGPAPSKVYLMRGDEVWLFDEDTGRVDPGYPRAVSEVWSGLPSGITGGEMLDDGSLLFLKGNRYFQVDTGNRVMSPRGRQSRLFSVDFLGCPPPQP